MTHIDKTASDLAETFTAFELAKALLECKNVLESATECCVRPCEGCVMANRRLSKLDAMISEANYE